MSAYKIADKILDILKLVPEPHIAAAAVAVDAAVTEIHEAYKHGETSLDAVRSEIATALAQALEPWQRIKDKAEASQLSLPIGSPGD